MLLPLLTIARAMLGRALPLARLRDQRAASLVEYVFLVALIAIVCLVAIVFLGEETSTKFSEVASEVEIAGT